MCVLTFVILLHFLKKEFIANIHNLRFFIKISKFPAFSQNRLYYLKKFYIHSKNEQDVQRFPICRLPPPTFLLK